MSVIVTIAMHVFKDAVRDRVLYNLVAFAVLMISASFLLGQLTAGQDVKIIKDLGLTATHVFGLFIAVFIGIGLVSTEVRRRSIYLLLSKPVRRHEVVLGKYLGLALTVTANLAVMVAAVYAVLGYLSITEGDAFKATEEAPVVDPALLTAFLLILAQLLLVTAIALFFSTFTSPAVSVVCTLGLYVVGHFAVDLRQLRDVTDSSVVQALGAGVSYLVPNLTAFDITLDVVHAQPVSATYVGLTVGYAAVYIAVLLVAAMGVFARRDLL